jgi:hypothetical protein
MQDAIKKHQADLETVNTAYRQLSEESRKYGVMMPDNIQQKITKLNEDWPVVCDLAAKMKPPSEYNLQAEAALRFGKLTTICIMFTPARDFLLETPGRIIIPNPNVSSHSLSS